MKLNKIMMVTILIFLITIVSGSMIDVPYFINSNTFDQTVNLGTNSNLSLKGEGSQLPKNTKIRLENCSLEPVVQRLLSRVTLKVLLALPRIINRPDKPPKPCRREKLRMFRLMVSFILESLSFDQGL
ncbi:hypothetical protein BB987_11030 [Photorhabdus temperata]|uniref:Uncharacterized protein n=2 Tax=Photorhabdus khanii TaxID=1004150 RepID=W3VC28_9GAMM|nr:type 1 fimbrial protein [Photorhabdus khanii]ETS33387.1 hypothetical protein PTE_00547 [Photorhabdus khanii NC19]MQL47741.1 hypothetical protein [Photorhabdus khanii]OHV53907.1 hypothetical protein BB987_11030 [Photorhabdus temperata]